MHITVESWEAVLRYRDGALLEVLRTGRHRRSRRRTALVRVDLRPRLVAVAGQEVLTADGLVVKATLLARLRVVDPQLAQESAQDSDAVAYAALQVALRAEVAASPLEDLVADREGLGARVTARVAGALADVGRAADTVALRDLMLPLELRRASLAVVTARQEGQAALERARGETAALRALANAARMVGETPALLSLRTLQAVEAGGATVELRPS
jgi:regulator of protease activity HflC (stomatin/prohibitin superfamily)